MKVWGVFDHYYAQDELLELFDSEEKAQQYVKEHPFHCDHCHNASCLTIDEITVK